MFRSEAEMSRLFQDYLGAGNHSFVAEFNAGFGIPDYLIVSQDKREDLITIGIELKLSKWKKALIQAFRYRKYTNISYVILDQSYAHRALANLDLFQQYNIGLASFNKEKELEIHFRPEVSLPFCQRSFEDVLDALKDLPKCSANSSLTAEC